MPINAVTSLAGPLVGAMQQRSIGVEKATGLPASGIEALQGFENTPGAVGAAPVGQSFGHFLQNAIGEVNQAQLHAGDLSTRFAAGEPIDVHQVMIAAQEASVALNLAIQVRNKLVDGYQELMRVSV